MKNGLYKKIAGLMTLVVLCMSFYFPLAAENLSEDILDSPSINETLEEEPEESVIEESEPILRASSPALLGNGSGTENICTLGSEISGTVPKGEEGIWYKLVLDKSYLLKLIFTRDMAIYKQNKTDSVWNGYGGASDKPSYGSLLKGTYYIKIFPDRYQDSPFSFTLSAIDPETYYQSDEEECDDLSTRNDDKTNASEHTYKYDGELHKEETIHGLIGPTNNLDWYHFHIEDPVKVSFNSINMDRDYESVIYEPSFTLFEGDTEIKQYTMWFPITTESIGIGAHTDYYFCVKKYNEAAWVMNTTLLHSYTIKLIPADKTVTYDLNGGTGEIPDTGYYIKGDKIELESNSSFMNGDRNFIGWCMNKNGTGTIYQPNDTYEIGDESVTFYAIWEAELKPDKYYNSDKGNSPSYYYFEINEDDTELSICLDFDTPITVSDNRFEIYKSESEAPIRIQDCTIYEGHNAVFRRINLDKGLYFIRVNSDALSESKYGIYINTYREGFDLTRDALPVRNTPNAYDISHKNGQYHTDNNGNYLTEHSDYLPDEAFDDVLGKFQIGFFESVNRHDPGYCSSFASVAIKEYINGTSYFVPDPRKYMRVNLNKSGKDDVHPFNKKEPVLWGDSSLHRLMSDYVVWFNRSIEGRKIREDSRVTDKSNHMLSNDGISLLRGSGSGISIMLLHLSGTRTCPFL